MESLTTGAILGLDFLGANSAIVNLAARELTLRDGEYTLPLYGVDDGSSTCASTAVVAARHQISIPSGSELEVMARVLGTPPAGTCLLESTQRHLPLEVARALVDPTEGAVPLRLLNPSAASITVYEGQSLDTLEQVTSPEDIPVASIKTTTVAGEPQLQKDKEALLWEMVDQAASCLDASQKEQLFSLLVGYADVFAGIPEDFGRTSKITHQIATGEATPVKQRTRRIAPAQRQEVRKLLQSMLDQKVIQPSSSPWASPIVLVRKKNGSYRFCVDYRKVNSITRKDAYPLPRVDDILDALAGSELFTMLDLISGYWQVEVAPKDRPKTAFCTIEGRYEFNVMPFGLCNAPATFQRLMDMVLAGLQWTSCLVYLDDIVIFGKSFDEHLQNLSIVLQRIREANLKLQPTKCSLCREEVSFLGHIVSAKGVATDPRNTDKVKEWPTPTSSLEVQQFLGLANYYRRFVKDFAVIAKPLHRLTEKGAVFRWSEACQQAFAALRDKLTSTPILAFPDFSVEFVLDTDASGTGIGAVLTQVQEGTERVIAYASRTLSKAERNYCVTRKELLAAVYFIRHFRPYLLGRKFTLRTDHGSLTWLCNFKQPEGQLARWLERLQEYDFEVVHRRGRSHQNADALSRRPCTQCGREFHLAAVNTISIARTAGYSKEELLQSQLSDPVVGPILKAKERSQRLEANFTKQQGPRFRRLDQLWDQLLVQEGLLYRCFEDAADTGPRNYLQLVIPHNLQRKIFKELHAGPSGCHLGGDKTLSKLSERFYWPGQFNDVKRFCATCTECQTRKTAGPRRKGPLKPVVVGYPMQMVAVDILGPLPHTENGNNYILVAADYFTRWMEAWPIPNQEAKTVAECLTKEMFYRFAIPEQLHSDQGRQFESEVMQEICRLLQVQKTRTTPGHPQSDGLVERFNRTLLNMLSTVVGDLHSTWDQHLRAICMAYNTSVQPSTGYSPFFLMFGRQPRLPIDLGYQTQTEQPLSTNNYVARQLSILEDAFRRVRTTMGVKQDRQKHLYDRKIHGDP